jgi:hypothetical protein
MAIAAAAGFLILRQGALPNLAQERSPRLSRTRVEIPASRGSTAPDPAWLLAQRRELSLNASQLRRLSNLQARWDHDTRSLQVALQQATADFHQKMAAKGRRGRMPADLRERAAPVSLLTGQLLAARRSWWSEAGQVLTAAQRKEAGKLWEARFVSRAVPPASQP